jgi:hypothetical protein
MSVTDMAHESASLPAVLTRRSPEPRRPSKVNFYLPEQHHVESVHFSAAGGAHLHAALAVVQTPAREVYLLRDNGMQVGTEEEGVADVWRTVIGCDARGVVS